MGIRSQEQYALLTDYDNTTTYSEAFYKLFANIRFHWKDRAARTHSLLVTGASAYKDQPSIAANLAIVSAQSDIETILVDADLRHPTLQQRFGLPKDPGLSDLLEDTGASRAALPQKITTCLQSTFVQGLRVLGAGTGTTPGASVASLLLSPRLETVMCGLQKSLEESEKSPGIVIYHSPAVGVGADASLIGTLAEQTLLTVIVGHTTRVQAKQAQAQLEQAHVNLAGVVLLNP